MVSKTPFLVSYKPHLHNGTKISVLYLNIIAALLPAALFGISVYGMHAFRVIALTVASSMLSELLYQKLFKKEVSLYDGSAALTGLLLALILPASVPYWLIIVSCFVAMLIGKHVFGGLGSAPFNTVLVAWAIIRISWAEFINMDYALVNYDTGFSLTYLLSALKSGGVEAISDISLKDLFLGKQAGGIGATSGLLLSLGGLYLIIRGFISWKIPLSFLIGVVLISGIFNFADSAKYASPIFHILTGNVLIAAFFLSTDYSSSPSNPIAQIIFGLGAGMLVILFRVWSIYPDAVPFAILLMNIASPLFEKIKPKRKSIKKVVLV